MIYYDIHTHKHTDNKNIKSVCSIDLGNKEYLPKEYVMESTALFSAGIHPWNINMDKMKEVQIYAALKNVVAIGETGLDKLKINTLNDFKIQQKLFHEHICIAEKNGKPLIIHCVRAWNELLAMKREIKPKVLWIIHGFRGGEKLAEQLINERMVLSFGKFFNAESLKTAWEAEHFLIETDNESDIREVYDKISTSLNISKKELSEKTGKLFMSFNPTCNFTTPKAEKKP